MEEIDFIVVNSLNKYFTLLEETGYTDCVHKLIVLIGILYILDNFNEYITEDDMRTLINVLYCIGGNCLIDYPSMLSEDSLFHKIKYDLKLRIHENEKYKLTEDNIFRIKA